LAAALTVSGPVTLQYSASTSENDSCTGRCNESFGPADYSSYSRTAAGTLQGTASFTVSNGTTTPGTGPLNETADTYNASGTFTNLPSQCGSIAGSATEVAQGGTIPGSLTVESLAVTTNSSGQPDLKLLYDDFSAIGTPTENTSETFNTNLCSGTFPSSELASAYDIHTASAALGLYDAQNPACSLSAGCFDVTGWTINPNWTPQTGGTLATKTLTGSAPQPQDLGPDTGTVTATQTWTLATCGGSAAPAAGSAAPAQAGACGLAITSPPADSTLALTDPQYFNPQPGPNDRQPEQRNLTVEGTAPPGIASITLNGTQVPVAGGAWKAELPVTMAQLGQLTLKASDGTDTVQQTNTLIDIQITSPTENASQPIAAAPAMPALNATLSVPGYPGDTSGVSFDWTLDARGETVSRPGTWAGYSQQTTGSTTGTGEAWQPNYDHIVGGISRLSVIADLPGVQDNPVTSEPRWFNIPGTNPPAAAAKAFVDQADPQYADPIRHIVCIESSWHQFNTMDYFPTNNNQPPIPSVPADWKPNPGTLQPLYGPPAGIGISQQDPAHLLTPDEYWNWQANMQSGVAEFHRKLLEATRWTQAEQARLDARLHAALKRANADRAAHHLPPLHVNPIQVPQLTNQQLIYQAIRYYNGQSEYHFDADYVLSADGLNVHLVPQVRQWQGGTDQAVYGAPPSPDGHWGHVPANLHDRQPWVAFPINQNYVDVVRNCQNS
jgi:hypothetical protein